MATFTVTYPDALQSRLVMALSERGGWNSGLGVTRANFARQQIVDFVREELRLYEAEVARAAQHAASTTDGNQVT